MDKFVFFREVTMSRMQQKEQTVSRKSAMLRRRWSIVKNCEIMQVSTHAAGLVRKLWALGASVRGEEDVSCSHAREIKSGSCSHCSSIETPLDFSSTWLVRRSTSLGTPRSRSNLSILPQLLSQPLRARSTVCDQLL